MLKIKGLTKKFGTRVVLNNLDYTFPDTGIVLINGENGSGKTTLLNLITLNDINFEGEIIFGGLGIKKMSDIEIQKLKNKYIAYVTQKNNLITFLSDEENEHIDELKTYKEKKNNRNIINNLSEGEQMICALNKAVASDKKVYVFDEVFSSLDEKNQTLYFEKIKELAKKSLVIIVSHFLNSVDGIDTILKIKNGNLYIIKDESTKNDSIICDIKNVKSKFSFKLFKKSFSSNKLLKTLFLIISFCCLSFCVGGTGLTLLRPGVAICNEIKSLPALYFQSSSNNVNLIEENFKDDVTYLKAYHFVITEEIDFPIIDCILMDKNITDDKIHLSEKYFEYLQNNYSNIQSLDDLLVLDSDEKADYEFVIDNNCEKACFYAKFDESNKKGFYLWLNDSNRKNVFEYINRYYILFDTPFGTILQKYDPYSKEEKTVNESLYTVKVIIEAHLEFGRKKWLIVLSILTIISFLMITSILLVSIRKNESRNIKILQKEGFQRYEINAIIYGPYLLMFLLCLLIGKAISFYLYPTTETFGTIIWFVPENFFFYFLIFLGIWSLSYVLSKRSQKWEI